MTYPLAFNLKSFGMQQDGLWFSWHFWWFKKSITELHKEPFHTDYILYPNEVDIVMSSPQAMYGTLSIPFQYFLEIPVILNLFLLLSFVLSGFAAYLLINYLTKNRKAAFVGGLLYAFAPVHFTHVMLGQQEIASIQWIPFFILYLLKTFNERKTKHAVIAALFLFYTAITSFYYFGFLFYFVLVFLAYNWVYNKEKLLERVFLRKFALIIVLFFLMIFPFFYAASLEIGDALRGNTYILTKDHYHLSADLFQYFV